MHRFVDLLPLIKNHKTANVKVALSHVRSDYFVASSPGEISLKPSATSVVEVSSSYITLSY